MILLKVLQETVRTLKVTTYNPVGWSLQKIHSRWRSKPLDPQALEAEHESPILLVHGIFHNSTAFFEIEKTLKNAGFLHISTIELWTSIKGIDDMAEQLKSRVQTLQALHPRKKVRILAHSLGGLVVRAALLDNDFANRLDKVIFLGVPHQGNRFYSLPYPPCLRDLRPASPYLRSFKNIPLPGGVQYWNIRGSLDLVTPSRDTFLPNVPNISMDGVGHAGLLSASQVRQALVAILETPLYDESFEEA